MEGRGGGGGKGMNCCAVLFLGRDSFANLDNLPAHTTLRASDGLILLFGESESESESESEGRLICLDL
jgi:hypothetical protein